MELNKEDKLKLHKIGLKYSEDSDKINTSMTVVKLGFVQKIIEEFLAEQQNTAEDSEFVYKTGEPELGDFIECHTDLVMEETGQVKFVKGYSHRVLGISECGKEFWVSDLHSEPHYFDVHEQDEDSQCYTKWFKLKRNRYE